MPASCSVVSQPQNRIKGVIAAHYTQREDGDQSRLTAVYQRPYSMTAFAQERLVMEVSRWGSSARLFQASQQASRMAS